VGVTARATAPSVRLFPLVSVLVLVFGSAPAVTTAATAAAAGSAAPCRVVCLWPLACGCGDTGRAANATVRGPVPLPPHPPPSPPPLSLAVGLPLAVGVVPPPPQPRPPAHARASGRAVPAAAMETATEGGRRDGGGVQNVSSPSTVVAPSAETAAGGGYYGYVPVSPDDYPYAEDVDAAVAADEAGGPMSPGARETLYVNERMLRDRGRTSKRLLVGAAFFLVSFLVLLIWLILIATCKTGDLCRLLDRSTVIGDRDYRFKTFEFLLPSVYVWAAMTVSVAGMAVATFHALKVIREDVGTPRMVELATAIRQGSTAFLSEEYRYLFLLCLGVFVLLGIGTNWRLAGCYVMGALLSAVTGAAGMAIATRGNVRTAAAAHQGLAAALGVAFRSGTVMGLSVVCIGLGGVAAAYLMFQDVRALAGFSAGASTIALFARVAGGIFTKAADVGADLVGKVESSIPEDDPRNPATIADNVGDNVGDVAGMGADLFESFVGSIISTAILGGGLPYFYRSPLAMCVFNHLHIDRQCGPAGYPETLSYARYICFQNDRYLDYPTSTTWASNSIFVALPFMLAAVGVLACIVGTVGLRVSSSLDEDLNDPKQRSRVTGGLLWSLRANVLLTAVLVLLGAVGLCWGFFGGNSHFQAQSGFSKNGSPVPVFELDTSVANPCRGQYEADPADPVMLPQGQIVEGVYKPTTVLGFQHGAAHQTPWRLFLCILIGLSLGLAIGWVTEYFTSAAYGPTQGIASAGAFGAGAVMLQGLGVGMLSTLMPLAFVVAAILSAYALFGPYGIALAAVGMLSTLGVTMATDAYGPVADNAGGIAEMAKLPPSVRETTDALDALGNTTAATGKGFSNGSAVLTAYALLTALLQDSGELPSPRALVGSPFEPATALINQLRVVSLLDPYVLVSVLVGVMLPFLFGAFVILAVSRAAQAMIAEVRHQFRVIDGLRAGAIGVRPDHVRCVGIATRAALFEMILPGTIAFMSPLIVGFGFGQRALMGMLLAAIASSFVLGTMMSNAGGSFDNAKKLVETGEFGTRHAKSSEWHKATVAGDTLGDGMKDAAGPSLNILQKLMTSIGLVTIGLMNADQEDGWIGAILLGVTLLVVALFGMWNIKLNRDHRRAAAAAAAEHAAKETARAETEIKAPPKMVSPFFEDGRSIVAPDVVIPGSQLHEALHAVGMPRHAFADTLPGLSDRDEVDFSRSPARLMDGAAR